MLRTGPSSQVLVIDANVEVWATLPILQREGVDAYSRLVAWHLKGVRLIAPTLWLAEATSAIRRTIFTKIVTESKGWTALEDIFTLGIESVPLDAELCRAALGWAARLKQAKAYDAFYLALAEQVKTELWTADERLVNASQQAGASWVYWIGES